MYRLLSIVTSISVVGGASSIFLKREKVDPNWLSPYPGRGVLGDIPVIPGSLNSGLVRDLSSRLADLKSSQTMSVYGNYPLAQRSL